MNRNKHIICSMLFVITTNLSFAQGVINVDNESFFNLVLPLLDEGHTATITGKGKSMNPFIINGEKLLLEKRESYKVGDIALAHTPDMRYVLHRIVSYSNNSVVLMGDGNLTGTEQCHPDSLKAICRYKFDNNGNKVSLVSDSMKTKAELWKKCINQREKLLLMFSTGNHSLIWKNTFLEYLKSEKNAKMAIRHNYILKTIGNNNILISTEDENIDFSRVVTVNESATFLFSNLKGKDFSLQMMVKMLFDEYEVDRHVAEQDCIELLTQWFEAGIIKII